MQYHRNCNYCLTGTKLESNSYPWTMAAGSKQIPVVGMKEKREITVLLAATGSGILLPPQVTDQGKTPGCHAKVTFTDKWNITQSENEWSIDSTMLEYQDKSIVSSTLQQLDLPEDQPALTIFDAFAANSCCCVLDHKGVYVYRDRACWSASLPYIWKISVSVAIGTLSRIYLHKRVPMVKIWGSSKNANNGSVAKIVKFISSSSRCSLCINSCIPKPDLRS